MTALHTDSEPTVPPGRITRLSLAVRDLAAHPVVGENTPGVVVRLRPARVRAISTSGSTGAGYFTLECYLSP
jgi:hypothetical protein